jgi:pseudouridine-5'-phosphate glycosidase
MPPRRGQPLSDRLDVAPEVAEGLMAGRPVVALESTLISHGLAYPENLVVARDAEAAVRDSGAIPATIAIRHGRILVGFDAATLEHLATAPSGAVRKVSRHTLAATIVGGGWGATTVAATMLAARAAGIAVMATGGIGGVHRGAIAPPGRDRRPTLDISADLEELARTPMVVVCAGPKAILDVPATLEYLETRGVPVLAIGQDDVPGFYARSSGIRAQLRADGMSAAAAIAMAHLSLGIGSAILACVPVPDEAAVPDEEVRLAVERSVAEALDAGIAGPALTPWLLARVAELTAGRSASANRALIVNDARVAGQLSVEMAGPARISRRGP